MPTANELAAFNNDMAVIEDNTVTIDGLPYSCTLPPFQRGDTLEEGGFTRDYDLSVHIRRELLANVQMPKVRESQVTYGTAEFQIVRIIDDPDTVMIEFQLASNNATQ